MVSFGMPLVFHWCFDTSNCFDAVMFSLYPEVLFFFLFSAACLSAARNNVKTIYVLNEAYGDLELMQLKRIRDRDRNATLWKLDVVKPL